MWNVTHDASLIHLTKNGFMENSNRLAILLQSLYLLLRIAKSATTMT